jgi:uncharacterized damage-inducible protein DinB
MDATPTVTRRLGEAARAVAGTLLVCLLAPPAAFAQGNPATQALAAPEGPLSAHNKFVYAGLKSVLLRSAEKMAEEDYGFRPTDAVRSFGQIVGHLVDSQYLFCSIALGEKNPAPKIEQTRTSKAELMAALKEGFAYCDKAYDGMTDASAAQMVMLFGSDTPRLSVLSINNMHGAGHYGNLVTYMRMKNVVPPTSEPGFTPRPKK